ncbi:MAG: UDP-N-acetylmuramate--L-alanine ligase [Acidobacteria bacterium]|nr:UDP-N-acetylmuramate--L-alanine ligase [Acidobacteriota bacterium]
MFGKIQKLHFVGIGGIGMSGIAELLLNLGYQVSGSDRKQSPLTDRLAGLGGKIKIGHDAANINGAHVVVISSAVRPDNVEVVEAKKQHIPVIPRVEMLAELMRLKYGVAVAGAHGKTTATSMIATVLVHGGLDPTAVIGGRLNAFGSNAKLGKGDFLVAEADESDGSFLKLSPAIAVVTNIDREHMDHYADLEEIRSAFVSFVNKVPFYGAAILCLDNPNVQAIIPRIERQIITYGIHAPADLAASRIEYMDFGSSCRIQYKGKSLGILRLQVPGEHGILNALAAIATGLELDIPFETVAAALESFQNADRRFQIKGRKNDILVVDDYGHHPTEIVATLKAARLACSRRIVTVFQPHRYTRIQALEADFAQAFHDSDLVLITPIYAAGEKPIPGVTAEKLVERIREWGHQDALYAPDFESAGRILEERVRDGDLLLTLGAGDVWQVGEEFLR